MPATQQTRVRKTGTAVESGKGKFVRKKSATATGVVAVEAVPPGGESREQMIALAAYFRAEKRGFAPGGEVQDWLDAEAELERLLKSA